MCERFPDCDAERVGACCGPADDDVGCVARFCIVCACKKHPEGGKHYQINSARARVSVKACVRVNLCVVGDFCCGKSDAEHNVNRNPGVDNFGRVAVI